MKIHKLAALFAVCATSAFAQFTLSGTALLKTPNTQLGDFGVLIVDVNNVGFGTIDLDPGEILSSGSSFGDFVVVIAPKAFAGNATTWAFNASVQNVAFDNGISTGDKFAIVTFESSSTTALAGDTFRVWTDPSWLVPAAGGGLSFSTTGNAGTVMQLGTASSPVFTGTIGTAIPEPSSFAALAGFAVLGFATSRRRRA